MNSLNSLYIIALGGGLGEYLLVLFLNREPGRRAALKHKRALGGAFFMAYSVAACGWVMVAQQAIPTRVNDPALWLSILTVISGVLTGLFSGMILLVAASMNKLHYKDKRAVTFPPIVLSAGLLLFPLLSVPKGSLVAQNGKILPFGTSYNFRPGFSCDLTGLNNPARVGVRRKVLSQYWGNTEMSITANITLLLKPGDRIPVDLNWYRFQSSLADWFDSQLGTKVSVEPRVEDGWYIPECSLGITKKGVVMGVPVAWEGLYSFRK